MAVVQAVLGNSTVCVKAVFVAFACCMQQWVSAALGDTATRGHTAGLSDLVKAENISQSTAVHHILI